MYPYLYLPSADFDEFANIMHKRYERFYQHKICDDGKCKWDKPCSEVQSKKDVDLGITIKDFDTEHEYVIGENDMFIPGTDMGDEENTCYLAVFKS